MKKYNNKAQMIDNTNEHWAIAYVEFEQPIPLAWRSDFYDELVSEDLEYRYALEDAVRWHGVRWSK